MLPIHNHTNDYYPQPQPPSHPHLDQAFESDEGEGEWEDSISSSRGSSHSGSGGAVRYRGIEAEDEEGGLTSLLNSRSSSSSVFKGALQDYRGGTGRARNSSTGLQLGQGQSEQQQQQAGRSFKGCAMCRKSKVKCGEEKPGCGRCIRRGLDVSLGVSCRVVSGVVTDYQLVR